MASKTLTRSIADGIARRGLPFSAFRNEQEWRDTLVFLADAVDAALIAYGAERAGLIPRVHRAWSKPND